MEQHFIPPIIAGQLRADPAADRGGQVLRAGHVQLDAGGGRLPVHVHPALSVRLPDQLRLVRRPGLGRADRFVPEESVDGPAELLGEPVQVSSAELCSTSLQLCGL